MGFELHWGLAVGLCGLGGIEFMRGRGLGAAC